MSERRFGLGPGVEVVRVTETRYTLRSEFDAYELSGEAAAAFAHVLAELDRPLSLDEIRAKLPGYSPDSVERQLQSLVDKGLVAQRSTPADRKPGSSFGALFNSLGSSEEVSRRLAASTVAVFGLEAHGAHLAHMLAQQGVGHIVLADPFAFESQHLALTPVRNRKVVGLSRQAAIAALVRPSGVDVTELGGDTFDSGAVRRVVAECDLAVGCWDQSFGAASHWLNRSAVETGVPALYGELRATSTIAGPLVLPGRSACWMCYRMRAVACAPDFEQAMAFEEHLDQARRPRLAERPLMPVLPEHLAAVLALEALRQLTGVHPPALVDNVSEFDALSNATENHPVLPVPDCPVCSKAGGRDNPPLDALTREGAPGADISQLAERLVDARTGIVAEFGAVPRDPSEVPIPIVWRARLANHRFLPEHDDERATCSGKGMTRRDAWKSCLGEAVERYSGAVWRTDELRLARRHELDGRSLDPRELVLYRDDQYGSLPYTPYHDNAELSWVRSRSLTQGDEVWVPAVGVFMDYPAHSRDEYLFPITSNGLAAGPTLHDAVFNALAEVLERDAFLIAWLNRLPGHPHDAAQHPHEDVRRLARLYQRRGVHLELIELPTDHPVSVFVGIGMQQSGDGPSAVVGLGADTDPVEAARKASLEVGQVRPAVRRRAHASAERISELVADPSMVSSMEDHALLYADPSTKPVFRFLFGEPRTWEVHTARNPRQRLGASVEHLRAAGQDVLYVNLTPPDMASIGVFTVRVMVPGFQPIWFGHAEPRLGGRRLYEFAARQGLTAAHSEPGNLNPMPHPIA